MNNLLILVLLSLMSATSLASTSTTTTSTTSITTEFINWFERNGGKLQRSMTLREFKGMGRGVAAIQAIAAGTEIVQVPVNLTFSAKSLKMSNDPIHVKISQLGLEDELSVVAVVLLEKMRGVSSFYNEYISILPKRVPNLSYFSAMSLAELQNPLLEKEIASSKIVFQKNFDLFKEKVSVFLPPVPFINSNSNEADDAQATGGLLEEFKWASSIVDSRGLRFRGKVYLSPFVDMFNYAPHPIERGSDNGAFFLKHHVLEEEDEEGEESGDWGNGGGSGGGGGGTGGMLRVYADRQQGAGAQLAEDYGDNRDSIYLQYHGFVPDHNPFRCWDIATPAFETLGVLNARVIRYGFKFQESPRQCVAKDGKLSKQMIVYLAASVFNSDECASCLQFYEEHSATGGKINWTGLLKDCGFSDVENRLLADIRSEEKFSTVLKGLDFQKQTSLYARTIKAFQGLLVSHVPASITSLTFDESLVISLSTAVSSVQVDEAGSATTTPTPPKLPEEQEREHRLLAVRYRLVQKRLMARLLSLYNVKHPKLVLPSSSRSSSSSSRIEEEEKGGIIRKEGSIEKKKLGLFS